jgi:hypothetical protein
MDLSFVSSDLSSDVEIVVETIVFRDFDQLRHIVFWLGAFLFDFGVIDGSVCSVESAFAWLAAEAIIFPFT